MFRFLVSIAIFSICLIPSHAFFSATRSHRSKQTIVMGVNPTPSGFSSTKEGKAVILERTKNNLDLSSIVLAIPFEGVTKEQTDMLRKAMPKTAKASIVKNSLMRKACEGTPFEPIGSELKQENMFFFIPEGESKPAMEAYKKWQKEVKRTDKDGFAAKFGAMDGTLYEGKGLDAIVNLPTKKELITKIAQGIKAVPTKVGRGINAVPNKLGRAFGALKNKLEEEPAVE